MNHACSTSLKRSRLGIRCLNSLRNMKKACKICQESAHSHHLAEIRALVVLRVTDITSEEIDIAIYLEILVTVEVAAGHRE